jgi:hypothetical protein
MQRLVSQDPIITIPITAKSSLLKFELRLAGLLNQWRFLILIQVLPATKNSIRLEVRLQYAVVTGSLQFFEAVCKTEVISFVKN